ncbi:MAG: reverse transcriptase family protein, partial [Anaplasma sp.]|nr:reverse transcriptase family protein [Anaplasma sp.]
TVSDVLFAIKKLSRSMSVGPDNIPGPIVKAYAELFAPTLAVIFDKSLKSGLFPEFWKASDVVPVHKSGKKTAASNYRPVSLLCVFSKVFETVVHLHMSSFFKNVIVACQHGFMPGRSTVTNLTCFMNVAVPTVCRRGQLDVIYFDLSKAFDVVDHNLLLKKLQRMGVRGSLLGWFSSYLDGRVNRVRVESAYSSLYNSSSGVPQGSILGPLLFTLFVNDVQSCLSYSSILQFADDMKIFRAIESVADCRELQEDIDRIGDWCSVNNLVLNKTKTKVVTYSRKTGQIMFPYKSESEKLERTELVRDLGVYFDSKLNFHSHMETTFASAMKTLGVISRITSDFSQPFVFIALFNSLCRSRLEYASVVWNGCARSNEALLDRVQKKFAYILNFRYLHNETYSYTGVADHYSIESLSHRRRSADFLFLFKCLHGMIDSPELLSLISLRVPRYYTVSTSAFYPLSTHELNPIARMQFRYNEFSHKLDIFDANISGFRASLRLLL